MNLSSLYGGGVLIPPVNPSDHSLGNEDAIVTLVEYGDYECQHCGQFHAVVKGLLAAFPVTLRFVFRHFPLSRIHRHAEFAAICAEAAGALGRFWSMHDALLTNQRHLRSDNILRYAIATGLDENAFVAETTREQWPFDIRADLKSGLESGVNGTPTLFVNGRRYNGPMDASSLEHVIRTVEGVS